MFFKFRRRSEMPIADFIAEFERLYNKAKTYKTGLPKVYWLIDF